MSDKKVVIDAKGAVVGRLASFAAKQALLGKEIIVVNANEALLTGKKRSIIEEYNEARQRGGSSLKGPFFPKHPDRIIKRTIRGMLDYQKGRGLAAFKRVLCYSNTPLEYKDTKKISFIRPIKNRTLPLKELSKEI